MPIPSTQVAGLIGGQQVMFSNQAAFANSIGPAGMGQTAQMANPYPASSSFGIAGFDPSMSHTGAAIAGSAAMAIPAAATGVGMAASMFGYRNPLGLLDPTTAITRSFAAGTGVEGAMAGRSGMGIIGAGRQIGAGFMEGGLRGGLAVAGRGAMAAMPMVGATMAVGAGIQAVGEQMYQGVQNIQDVSRMTNQYFTSQVGKPGAGLGGRPPHQMVKEITGMLHEFASEDMMTSMKDMRKLMDVAGQTGMLQGIGDANQFKQNFVRRQPSVYGAAGSAR